MQRRITDVIRSLNEGEVVSYGDIADVAGFPGRARLVGRLLAVGGQDLPWWRVVTASGRLIPGQESRQRRMLADEGVEVTLTRVVRSPSGRFARQASPSRSRRTDT